MKQWDVQNLFSRTNMKQYKISLNIIVDVRSEAEATMYAKEIKSILVDYDLNSEITDIHCLYE